MEDEICFTDDEKNQLLQQIDELEKNLLHNDVLSVDNIKFSWKNYIETGRQRRKLIAE